MAPPSKDTIRAATSALRSEAGTWDSMSGELGKAVEAAQALRMTRLEAGLFQLVVGPYEEAAQQIIDRATEGRTHLSNVGSTLRQVAETYDAEEAANEHQIRNVY